MFVNIPGIQPPVITHRICTRARPSIPTPTSGPEPKGTLSPTPNVTRPAAPFSPPMHRHGHGKTRRG